jgi:hypothetical protein
MARGISHANCREGGAAEIHLLNEYRSVAQGKRIPMGDGIHLDQAGTPGTRVEGKQSAMFATKYCGQQLS